MSTPESIPHLQVIVVGGGQAGLSMSACLQQSGKDRCGDRIVVGARLHGARHHAACKHDVGPSDQRLSRSVDHAVLAGTRGPADKDPGPPL